jgi:hypothetical protein
MHKVRIGYRDFKIKPFPQGFGERLDGETDFSNLTIMFHESLDPSVKSSTLLHEILHVVFDEFALAKDDCEERVVSAFTNGLCQVIRDNPDVLAFIIGGLRK